MKPILYAKEVETIALLKKQMKCREVANIVEFSQSKMIRIRKNHFKNIVMPRRGRPQTLTTWEKRNIVCLVTIGGLDSTFGNKRA
jgi:6-phosphofructokinase